MAGRWRWIAVLLACALSGCVTSGVVRLETGRAAPILYRAPSGTQAVEVGQREFVELVCRLVLKARLPLKLAGAFGDEPAFLGEGWGRGGGVRGRESPRGRFMRVGLFASPGDSASGARAEAARVTLAGAAVNLTQSERQSYALSFALEGAWAGVGEAVRGTVEPVALKAMLTSVMCAYLVLLVLPEPVTKFVALAMSAYLVAYVGYFPLWNMVKAYKQLRDTSGRATSLRELEEEGRRFGRVVGDNGMRVLIMVMLAAQGGKEGLASRGPTLPGYGAAAVAFEANTGVRLAAVAEGGVESFSVRQGALVIDLAPSAVATTAWSPGGGGGPKLKGRLTGRPTRLEKGEEARPLERENETARILAENGYDVEQNPPPRPNGKHPDYKVNGEYADCVAPITPRVRNIAKTISEKVSADQAGIIIVNLEDAVVSMEDLSNQIAAWPIEGLQKLFAIKGGRLVQLFP